MHRKKCVCVFVFEFVFVFVFVFEFEFVFVFVLVFVFVFVFVQCVMQKRKNSLLLYNCVRWGQCIMPHRNGHGVHRNELCRPSEWINTQTVVEIRSYRPWRDKQICLLYAIWLIHTCDMYDSFICVSWLVPFCNMTKFCVTWLIASNMTSRSASYV